MTRPATLAAMTLAALAGLASQTAAHCQVPCGIYGDQRRFDEMLEDTETITKCIDQIGELSGTHDATDHNQLVRWVTTKEDHATNIMRIIGDYFMAQRIKPDADNYGELLKSSHAVMTAAMKTKQGAEPDSADKLGDAIKAFYEEYTGKEYQAAHTH